MGDITIEVDTRALDEALEVLGPRRGSSAIAKAINLTATSVRAKMLKELAVQVGLTQRALGRSVKVQRVSAARLARVASGREGVVGQSVRATARVTAAGADIPLTAFSPRQTRQGVSFSPGRKARRRTVPGAFIARMRGGYTGVFIRSRTRRNVLAGDAQGVRRRRRVPGRGPSDLPISKVMAPGVSRAMFDAALQSALQSDATDTLAARLAEQINFQLLKATGRVKPRPRRRRRSTQ